MGSALSKIGVPSGVDTYSAALEGLTAVNEVILGALPDVVSPYDVGVRYKNWPHSKWRNAFEVGTTKTGDCEALSTWRTAQLHVTGEDPDAHVAVYPTGRNKYHAIVVRGDGSIEDPSAKTGMRIMDREKYYDKIRGAFGDDVAIDDGTGDYGGGADYDLRPTPPVSGDDVGTLDPRAMRQQHMGAVKRRRAKLAAEAAARDALTPVVGDIVCGCGHTHMALPPEPMVVVGEDSQPGTSQVTFDIVHTPHGFTGVMRVPMANGGAIHAKTSPAKTPKGAKQKNANMAGKVAETLAKAPGSKSALTDTSKAAMSLLKSDLGKTAINVIPYGGAAMQALDMAGKIPGAGQALALAGKVPGVAKLKKLKFW